MEAIFLFGAYIMIFITGVMEKTMFGGYGMVTLLVILFFVLLTILMYITYRAAEIYDN